MEVLTYLFNELKKQASFSWITDGLGWKTAKNRGIHILNLNMLNQEVLNEIIQCIDFPEDLEGTGGCNVLATLGKMLFFFEGSQFLMDPSLYIFQYFHEVRI